MENNLIKRYYLLGVPIDTYPSLEALREHITLLMENGRSNQIIFLSYKMLFKARSKAKVMNMLEGAALVLAAEPRIIKALSFVHRKAFIAYTPIDTLITLLNLTENKRNKSAYLLGGSSKNLKIVYQNLLLSYPKLLFVGRHKGSFNKEQEKMVLEAIRKASPTLLIVSQGVGKGDVWIHRYQEEFHPGITLYIKEAILIFMGKKKRPHQRELQLQRGFKLGRILSYLGYGLLLLLDRMKQKGMSDE